MKDEDRKLCYPPHKREIYMVEGKVTFRIIGTATVAPHLLVVDNLLPRHHTCRCNQCISLRFVTSRGNELGRLTIVNPSYFFPAKASIGEERKPLETTCESETIPQIFVMTYITQ